MHSAGPTCQWKKISLGRNFSNFSPSQKHRISRNFAEILIPAAFIISSESN
uniref:Uncharacterized protein n=1 Tax=Arundo donax TaxID=35708 RepID=A0A0A8YB66_ARUDO